MKKIIIFSILTYLLFTINSSTAEESLNQNKLENKKILKIGVLLPLSGKFQDIGESYLKAIELADKPTKDWLEMTYSSKKVELKVSEVTEAFHKLNIEKHTMDMIQNYYTRAMSNLDLVVSDKKDLLIAFSDKLIDRVS